MAILSGCCRIWMAPLVRTKGTPPGQHWLRGLGKPTPANDTSPSFFTTSAASGFKIGLVQSPTSSRMLPTPLRRDRLTREVGPEASGSKPGMEGDVPSFVEMARAVVAIGCY